jgi:beta-lactamase class A
MNLPRLSLILLAVSACTSRPDVRVLRDQLASRIDSTDADVVGVYFYDLDTGDSVLLNADVRMHAASTMKVPVMIQLFRDADAGARLDADVVVRDTFPSIVDGSTYQLAPSEDSDTLLYQRIGKHVPLRMLLDRMITMSSNLATNNLVQIAEADRIQETMRELGADSITVLRGVQDINAYEAGLNNTTTARDLGIIFKAIAQDSAASSAGCDSMIAILSRQEFNEGIPAGLPEGTQVAHKTGWITGIRHDGGIVYPKHGSPYVLVVLTQGIDDTATADKLIADISRSVYQWVTD